MPHCARAGLTTYPPTPPTPKPMPVPCPTPRPPPPTLLWGWFSTIQLHDHCAKYAPPSPPPLNAVHYTILAMAISCKGQCTRFGSGPAGPQIVHVRGPAQARLRVNGLELTPTTSTRTRLGLDPRGDAQIAVAAAAHASALVFPDTHTHTHIHIYIYTCAHTHIYI